MEKLLNELNSQGVSSDEIDTILLDENKRKGLVLFIKYLNTRSSILPSFPWEDDRVVISMAKDSKTLVPICVDGVLHKDKEDFVVSNGNITMQTPYGERKLN